MTGPSYHARTHLPGGTDPLAIAADSWALLTQTVSQNCASGGTAVGLDLDGSTTGYFNTSDTTRYAVSAYTSGTYNGKHGLRIITPGLYLIRFSCNLSGSPTVGSHYEVAARESSGGSSFLGGFFYGQNELQFYRDVTGANDLDTYALAWTQVWEIEADITVTPFIITVTQQTGVTMAATSAILATVLSDSPLGSGANF